MSNPRLSLVLYSFLFISMFAFNQSGCSRHGDLDGRVSCPRGSYRFGDECVDEDGGSPANNPSTPVPETTPGDNNDGGESETATPDPIVLTITSPANEFSAGQDASITFEGALSGLDESDDYENLSVVWSSNSDGVLHVEEFSTDGQTSFSTNTLSPGIHIITLEGRVNGGSIGATSIQVGICGWELIEDFDQELSANQWKIYNDGYRDNRGWIEMTGNVTWKKGHIFNIGQTLNAGNNRLRFDISTGQCDQPGTCNIGNCAADGFAASVYNAESVEALDALVASTEDGGGLGYHISGEIPTESFHIEFDTYDNGVDDPTPEDHIAIHLNSDSHNAVFFDAVPDLEDNTWHDIILDIQGESISVSLDGIEIIAGDIPGFAFKGGYIGFSGTTGSCTNYHRIDNLRRQVQCEF